MNYNRKRHVEVYNDLKKSNYELKYTVPVPKEFMAYTLEYWTHPKYPPVIVERLGTETRNIYLLMGEDYAL